MMIGFKGIFAIISVICYTILIVTFFKFRPIKECTSDSPCIRFCSSDRVEISDVELFIKFGESHLFDNIISSDQNETKAFSSETYSIINYKVFRGEPTCVGGDETHYSDTISSKYYDSVCFIKISK